MDEKKQKYGPQKKYLKNNTVSLRVRIMKNTEQDIIEKLYSVPNKAGYIKQLIRQDIERCAQNSHPD